MLDFFFVYIWYLLWFFSALSLVSSGAIIVILQRGPVMVWAISSQSECNVVVVVVVMCVWLKPTLKFLMVLLFPLSVVSLWSGDNKNICTHTIFNLASTIAETMCYIKFHRRLSSFFPYICLTARLLNCNETDKRSYCSTNCLRFTLSLEFVFYLFRRLLP